MRVPLTWLREYCDPELEVEGVAERLTGPYADAGVSVVKNFVALNFSTRGFYGYPTNNVTIDGMVARGDESQLNNQYNYVQGINFDDYMTHNLVIQNADIQGMAVGIEAPFMVGRTPTMATTG